MKRFVTSILVILFAAFIVSDVCAQSVKGARKNLNRNKFDKAKDEAEKVIAKDPDEEEAYFILGVAMGALGDIEGMDANFEKCRSLTDEYNGRMNVERDRMFGINFAAGLQSLRNADNEKNEEKSAPLFNEAIGRFSSALKLREDDVQSKEYIGYSYLNLQDITNAEKYYTEVITADPENRTVLKNLGIISFERAYNLEDATVYPNVVKYYEKLIEVAPEEAPVIGEQLILGYEQTKQYDKGVQFIERLLGEAPDDPSLIMWKANLLLQKGDNDAALAIFRQALELNPDNVQLLTNIAWMPYLKLEEMKTAGQEITVEQWKAILPSMEKLSTVTPDDADVWNALVRMYVFTGDNDKAEKAMAEVNRIKGGVK
ncbi:MAG: tetratricopeptide repeat protein [bacterium]|nr:tetratricopeptide repeat protein [bacterium]